MVGTKGVVRALERLAGAAHERAIPFVVFDVKGYPGLDPKYVRDEWRDGQRELLERESRRLGFHFLNTYPYFMDYLNRHPNANLKTVFAVSEVDGHPNALAHAINAEAIFEDPSLTSYSRLTKASGSDDTTKGRTSARRPRPRSPSQLVARDRRVPLSVW